MLSQAQDRFYWRRWQVVQAVNHWRTVGGRLAPEAVGPERSEWHALVWGFARQRAARAHGSVWPEDLRHGMTVAASGRDLTHRALGQAEFERWLLLAGNPAARPVIRGLLVDPDCLGSVMAWQDFNEYRRQRKIAQIRRLKPEGYIAWFAREFFQAEQWERLSLPALENLRRQLFVRSGGAAATVRR